MDEKELRDLAICSTLEVVQFLKNLII